METACYALKERQKASDPKMYHRVSKGQPQGWRGPVGGRQQAAQERVVVIELFAEEPAKRSAPRMSKLPSPKLWICQKMCEPFPRYLHTGTKSNTLRNPGSVWRPILEKS